MTPDKYAPLETVWEGKHISALKRGRGEYVSRTGSTIAVVILAEHDGKVILIEQYRVPVGARCLELPAGLVGDEDPNASVEETAVKELEEEAGFTAERVERLGQLGADRGLADAGDDGAGDADVDVGLEQRRADLAEHLVDIAVGEPPLATEPLEDPLEPVGKRVEHGGHTLPAADLGHRRGRLSRRTTRR